VTFDPTLVRGLDYYTGPVFEVVCKDRSIGSLGGGGRYDELVGMFSNRAIPAVGTSFGLERIVEALVANGRLKSRRTTLAVELIDLVGTDSSAAYCGQLLRALRLQGVSCDLGYDRGSKPGKQLKSADRKKVPFVFIVGEQEIDTSLVNESNETFCAKAAVTVKRLSDGLQKTMSFMEAVKWVPAESTAD
jgi:histidyl-tRNA synthetase